MLEVKQNIVQMAQATCARLGERSAYSCLGASLSFREVDSLSDAFAAWLVHEQGLSPGDRVAIQLPNLMQYPVVALGVLKAQGVVVNLNPLYTAKEILPLLKNCGATVLVVLANVAHNAAAIVEQSYIQQVVVTEVGDMLGGWRGAAINFVIRYFKKQIKHYYFRQTRSLKVALSQGHFHLNKPMPPRDYSSERLAVLQYTGGTTGIPKTAMLSHRNLLMNMLQLESILGDSYPREGALMVSPLPIYHIYGFSLTILMLMHKGHHALLIPNPRDTDGFVALLRKVKMAGFIGINTLYKNLLDHPDIKKVDFSQLKICSSGGMALSEKIAENWQRLTGVRILEGYGLSECSPMVTANSYDDFKKHTVGKPGPGTELLLLTLNEEQAATGQPGEICVKGPQVMQGYWQNPEETARAIDANGWFHTGDIGVLDAEGYLRIIDRIKDIIVISGFNVYPHEIENHLCSHPDITDACALGEGDSIEPIIKVFVVSRNPAIQTKDVIAYCRQGLAAYKVPKQVEFRSSLPKSNVGKVLRRELRESQSSEGS